MDENAILASRPPNLSVQITTITLLSPIHAGVTLKCLPHKNSARGEIITHLICLPLLEYRRPHEKSSHYRIAPPK